MKEFIKQCYNVATNHTISDHYKPLWISFTLQSRPTLAKFGAESWLQVWLHYRLLEK
jgi:hypothetical protein